MALPLWLLPFGQALAAEGEEGREPARFYAAALVGGSFATLETDGSTAAPQTTIDGSGTSSAPFGGAAVGVVFDLGIVDLRLELEGTGGRSFSFDTPGSYATDARLWTIQGNFWFDYPLSRLFPDAPVVRDLAPFGGGGLGVRQTTLDTTNAVFDGSREETGLAWQGGVGLAYSASDTISIETRYQYADLGGAEITLFDAGVPQGTMDVDLGSHEVVAGLRVTFR